jgi:serine/threonine protein kinase
VSADSATGHARLGPYVLLERLRRSAYGFVELAYDTNANRFVALKSLTARARTPETAQRFLEEVGVWRRLRHGHLLRLLDEGQSRDGAAWAAGEWLQGVDVERLMECARGTGTLPSPAIAATLTAQLGDALAITVQAELGPRNLVVSFDGRAALVELGNLRFLGRRTPIESDPAFAYFVAPEVRRGEAPTARSDLYSMGVLLWYFLTGTPHSGEPENGETKERLRETLRQYRLDVDGELLTILWRALQENPRHRFESTRELKTALRAAIEGGFAPTEEIGEYAKQLCGVDQQKRDEQLAAWRKQYGGLYSPEEQVRTEVLERAPRVVARPGAVTGGGRGSSIWIVIVAMVLGAIGAALYLVRYSG